jgi:hypothetical protein
MRLASVAEHGRAASNYEANAQFSFGVWVSEQFQFTYIERECNTNGVRPNSRPRASLSTSGHPNLAAIPQEDLHEPNCAERRTLLTVNV